VTSTDETQLLLCLPCEVCAMTPPEAPAGARPIAAALPKYERIARRYAGAIEAGTLVPGERFPSVRHLAAEERASVTTVVQALARLESLGLVEARPRSGHFVRHRPRPPVPQPRHPRATAAARSVSVSALVAEVYRSARDPRVVGLGSAVPSPELLPTAALARALTASMRHPRDAGTRFELPPGLEALRRGIARRALTWGCQFSEDEVVITSGASEAVQLCLLAVARPGDVVAVECPAYYGTLQTVEALGLRVLEIPCHPDRGMDVDALAQRLDRHRVAAVLAVPTFSNPLGSSMPDEAKARLVRLLSSRGLPLIEDDVFGELAFGAVRPKPAKAFDVDGTVMLCSSFTKTLAPGFRVGFAVPGRHRERVEGLKFSMSVASPTLQQRAIARFLEGGGYDRHLRTLRDRLASIEACTASAVAQSFPPGTRVTSPQGGCFLWVELPPAVDAMTLHARALDAGVSISPGPIFSPSGGHRNCIRLSCGAPWTPAVDAAVRLVGRLATRLAETQDWR
jgi:DNA-binding transcriptional MocR family regulator